MCTERRRSDDDRHLGSDIFCGNQVLADTLLKEQGYVRHPISRSRSRVRLERVKHQFLTLFKLLGTVAKASNTETAFSKNS